MGEIEDFLAVGALVGKLLGGAVSESKRKF
jgi:hypothetical protein